MSVRIGIVGVGIMGSDHARIFANDVPGVEIASIFDADVARAKAVADGSPKVGVRFASARGGYAASRIAEAALAVRASGERVLRIEMGTRPVLYDA
jgi:predicted homoserine dehydrogenase-like protein